MLSESMKTLAALLLSMMMIAPAAAVTPNYVAPSVAATLSSRSQAYQVGIWSFILFLVCGALAVYALMSIDYSNDTLLTVDVEPRAAEKDE